jgi:hypothetical protein
LRPLEARIHPVSTNFRRGRPKLFISTQNWALMQNKRGSPALA